MVRRGTRTPNLWIAGPLLYGILQFYLRMLTEFVLISFIKPEERKTLNINISGYVNNIIIEL